MVDKNKLLSDLLDEKCRSNQIDDLLDTDQINQSWYRYHSVSALIKGQHSANASFDFCNEISQKIAQEPAIIAAPKATSSTPVNADIYSLSTDFKKFTSGFAVAATVAAVTFFSLQTTQVVEPEQLGSQVASGPQTSLPSNDTSNSSINANLLSAEQYELDIFNDRYISDLRRSDKGNIAPVSGEFVRTVRFTAEEWQAILEKSLEKQKQLEKARLEQNKD
jgi:negative regulator of sigma E activity